MSVKNLQDFYQVVLTDTALQDRLKTATDGQSFVSLAVALGEEKGYSFSFEDVETVLNQSNLSNVAAEGELSEEELIGVSGGQGDWFSTLFKPETWQNGDLFAKAMVTAAADAFSFTSIARIY